MSYPKRILCLDLTVRAIHETTRLHHDTWRRRNRMAARCSFAAWHPDAADRGSYWIRRARADPGTPARSHYNGKLRAYLKAQGAMETRSFTSISGSDMIDKFGYRECK